MKSNDRAITLNKTKRMLIGMLPLLAISLSACGGENLSANPLTNTSPTTSVETSRETMGQSNAAEKGKAYLAVMPFSRSGLITQLEYDGFSTSDATYGTDKQNANWNDQAAKKGRAYLDVMPFSRSGLITQLEYDGFTPDQASYGVTANGY
jgi:hypothetical protein